MRAGNDAEHAARLESLRSVPISNNEQSYESKAVNDNIVNVVKSIKSISKSDFIDNPRWFVAPVIVGTNRERAIFNHTRCVEYAKAMNCPVIKFPLPLVQEKLDRLLSKLIDQAVYTTANHSNTPTTTTNTTFSSTTCASAQNTDEPEKSAPSVYLQQMQTNIIANIYASCPELYFYFVPGMPGQLSKNMAVDFGIVNGTIVTINDLILDPKEGSGGSVNEFVERFNAQPGEIIELKYPPLAMIVGKSFQPKGNNNMSSSVTPIATTYYKKDTKIQKPPPPQQQQLKEAFEYQQFTQAIEEVNRKVVAACRLQKEQILKEEGQHELLLPLQLGDVQHTVEYMVPVLNQGLNHIKYCNRKQNVAYHGYGVHAGFAVTFHRIQAVTLDKVILQLNPSSPHSKRTFLSYQSLIVGISRVRKFQDLRKLDMPSYDHLAKLSFPREFLIWKSCYSEDGTFDKVKFYNYCKEILDANTKSVLSSKSKAATIKSSQRKLSPSLLPSSAPTTKTQLSIAPPPVMLPTPAVTSNNTTSIASATISALSSRSEEPSTTSLPPQHPLVTASSTAAFTTAKRRSTSSGSSTSKNVAVVPKETKHCLLPSILKMAQKQQQQRQQQTTSTNSSNTNIAIAATTNTTVQTSEKDRKQRHVSFQLPQSLSTSAVSTSTTSAAVATKKNIVFDMTGGGSSDDEVHPRTTFRNEALEFLQDVTNLVANSICRLNYHSPIEDKEIRTVEVLWFDARYQQFPELQGSVIINREDGNSVIWSSFRTLTYGVWLNDEVINLYFRLLQERDHQRNQPSLSSQHHYGRSLFLSSQFYIKLYERNTYNFGNVQRWTRHWFPRYGISSIFQWKRIYIPINGGRDHWSLIVVFVHERKIFYYDSFRNVARGNVCFRNVLQWMNDLVRMLNDQRRFQQSGVNNYPLDETFITNEWTTETVQDAPMQFNGYDCGVFTLMFARCVSEDKPNPASWFHQNDLCAARVKVGVELLREAIVDNSILT